MKRALKLVMTLALLGASLVGAGWGAILLAEHRATVYTDGGAIHQLQRDEAPRSVLWTPPERLPDQINSVEDDYEPRLSADGQLLLFVRGKAGQNADILIAQRTPEGWGEPERMVGINSDADDLGPELSRDGQTLYFYSNRSGGLGGYDLWVSRCEGDGSWSAPTNLGPSVNSALHDYGPALSVDGHTLYFASNRSKPTSAGSEDEETWSATLREDLLQRDYDLYLARVDGQEIGSARPLAALNTKANEGTPSISPAGDFLYFSSDRSGGFGAFDLYRSRMLDETYWPVENLGPTINTRANELDPSPSMGGFALHFSSDRLAQGRANEALDYNLYLSESREVFPTIDRDQIEVDWAGLWAMIGPWLLWALLLLLLLLLALLALRDGRIRGRWGKLGLLARCILLSLLLHALLLAMLGVWEVSSVVGEYLRHPGGTKVALISRASGSDIAGQIRGDLTSFDLEFAPAAGATRRETERLEPTRAESTSFKLARASIAEADHMARQQRSREADAPDETEQQASAQSERIEFDAEASVNVPESTPAAQRAEAVVEISSTDAPDPATSQTQLTMTAAQASDAALAPDQASRSAPSQIPQQDRTSDAQAVAQTPTASSLTNPAHAQTSLDSPQDVSLPQSAARAMQREQQTQSTRENLQSSARTAQPRSQSNPSVLTSAALVPEHLTRQPVRGPVADRAPAADAASGLVPSQIASGDQPRPNLPATVAQGAVSLPAGAPGAAHEEGALTMPRAAPMQADRARQAAPMANDNAKLARVSPAQQHLSNEDSSAPKASATSSDASSSAVDNVAPASSSFAQVELDSVGASVAAMPEQREREVAESVTSLPPVVTTTTGLRASAAHTQTSPSSSSSIARLRTSESGTPSAPSSPSLANATQVRSSSASSNSSPASTATPGIEIASLDAPNVSLPTGVARQAANSELLQSVPATRVDGVRMAQADSLAAPMSHSSSRRAALDPLQADAARVSSLAQSPSVVSSESVALDTTSARDGELAIAVQSVPIGDVALPSSRSTQWSDEDAQSEFARSMPTGSTRADVTHATQQPVSSAPLASLSPRSMGAGAASHPMTQRDSFQPIDSMIPLFQSDDLAQLPIGGAPALALAMPIFEMPEQPEAELYPQRAPEIREQLVEEGGGSKETEEAVETALSWLAARQSADGSWSGRDIPDDAGGSSAAFEFDTALTGLSLLCFLGTGHTHLEEGPYQGVVQSAVSWLKQQVDESGDLRTGETLYSQGIGTIALAEAYGMTRDPELGELAQRAVLFIARSRNTRLGGWRYEPGQEGDTSVLGWQVMAMISARRAGLNVPDDALEAAGAWLTRVTRPERVGLYAYKPGRRPTASMTAEAMYVRQILGHSRDAVGMAESANYVLRFLPDWDDEPNSYFWYYATLAMYQHSGDVWSTWNEALVRELIEHQRTDAGAAGSWDPTDRWAEIGGRVYQTAICALMLEVYYRYLPLYIMEREE